MDKKPIFKYEEYFVDLFHPIQVASHLYSERCTIMLIINIMFQTTDIDPFKLEYFNLQSQSTNQYSVPQLKFKSSSNDSLQCR